MDHPTNKLHDKKRSPDQKPEASSGRTKKLCGSDEQREELTLQQDSIWQALAKSGFLSSPDLGRLLLLTSKSIRLCQDADDESKDETIWKLLCWNHWSPDVANRVLQATQMPPETYFRMFAFPSSEPFSNIPTLPSLKYTPQDYVVIVNARIKEDGSPLFVQAVPGETIPEFFSKGQISVDLTKPIFNAFRLERSASYTRNFLHGMYGHDDIIPDLEIAGVDLKVSVDLLRRTDRKMIQLMMAISDYPQHSDPSAPSYNNKKCVATSQVCLDTVDSVSAGKFGPILKHMNHIENPYSYEPGQIRFDFRIHSQIVVEEESTDAVFSSIHGFGIETMLFSDNFGQYQDFESANLRMDDQPVQLAHILEGLQEWETAKTVPLQT